VVPALALGPNVYVGLEFERSGEVDVKMVRGPLRASTHPLAFFTVDRKSGLYGGFVWLWFRMVLVRAYRAFSAFLGPGSTTPTPADHWPWTWCGARLRRRAYGAASTCRRRFDEGRAFDSNH
jgi:hypothetical protein